MARFMVFGSVAWDRPIWLDRKLETGGRILGLVGQDDGDARPAGRLGGGAANAAACLSRAGHDVAVWSAVRDDELGDRMIAALKGLGVETSFVKRMPPLGGDTLLLIEPDGERTIVFQLGAAEADRAMRRLRKRESAPISLDNIRGYRPDGIYLRSTFAGSAKLAALKPRVCVSHWPQFDQTALPADILIGSRDDLGDQASPKALFAQARERCGQRLKCLILTEGKAGGLLISETGETLFSAPSVSQVNSTGAGDAFAAGVLEAVTGGASLLEAAEHGAKWGATTASLKGSAEQRPAGTYLPWAPPGA